MSALPWKTGRNFLTYALLAIFLLTMGCACGLNMGAKATPLPENAVWRESPTLDGLFYDLRAQFGVEGTFVLYDREENALIDALGKEKADLAYADYLTGGKVSLSAYIDNVLAQHFEQYREEIEAAYAGKLENLF